MYDNRGDVYRWIRQYDLAVQDYNKAIEINSNESDYYNRGRAYQAAMQLEKAIQNYDKVIELNPRYVHAYYFRGLAYYHIKNYEVAIKDYTKCIELDPKDKWNYRSRGKCYQQIGEEAKAQADFAKAKELGYKGWRRTKLKKSPADLVGENFFYGKKIFSVFSSERSPKYEPIRKSISEQLIPIVIWCKLKILKPAACVAQ